MTDGLHSLNYAASCPPLSRIMNGSGPVSKDATAWRSQVLQAHASENKVHPMRQNRSKRILSGSAAFLLVLAVAGLSTLAKDSKYLPKSHPLRHFSKVTKMEVVEQSNHFAPSPAIHSVDRLVPPEPEFFAVPLEEAERLTLRLNGLTICFQHRAPPRYVA